MRGDRQKVIDPSLENGINLNTKCKYQDSGMDDPVGDECGYNGQEILPLYIHGNKGKLYTHHNRLIYLDRFRQAQASGLGVEPDRCGQQQAGRLSGPVNHAQPYGEALHQHNSPLDHSLSTGVEALHQHNSPLDHSLSTGVLNNKSEPCRVQTPSSQSSTDYKFKVNLKIQAKIGFRKPKKLFKRKLTGHFGVTQIWSVLQAMDDYGCMKFKPAFKYKLKSYLAKIERMARFKDTFRKFGVQQSRTTRDCQNPFYSSKENINWLQNYVMYSNWAIGVLDGKTILNFKSVDFNKIIKNCKNPDMSMQNFKSVG